MQDDEYFKKIKRKSKKPRDLVKEKNPVKLRIKESPVIRRCSSSWTSMKKHNWLQ